jgi:hypothetical protein
VRWPAKRPAGIRFALNFLLLFASRQKVKEEKRSLENIKA